jgi:hypothetical protein
VDDSWPAPGARFHHTVGAGPLKISDSTSVVALDPPRLLVLEARAGFLGKALVRFELDDLGGDRTRISMTEKPAGGPMSLLWSFGGKFVMSAALWGRNQASLESLADWIETRSAPVTPHSPS